MFPFKIPNFLSGLFRKKVKPEVEESAVPPLEAPPKNTNVYIGMPYLYKIANNAISIKHNNLDDVWHRLATKIELAPKEELPQKDIKNLVGILRQIANGIPEKIKTFEDIKKSSAVCLSVQDWDTLKSAEPLLTAASNAYRNAGLGHKGQSEEQKKILNQRYTEDAITISLFSGTLMQQISHIEKDPIFIKDFAPDFPTFGNNRNRPSGTDSRRPLP